MNIKIDIDISEVEQAFNLLIEQSDSLMTAVVYGLRDELARNWMEIAKRELKSTRNEYIMSLEPKDDGPFSAGVELVGEFPNMIEQGSDPHDMQKGFERSSKRKTTKDGKSWYLTIPFRHATPGAVAENVAFSSVMNDELYRLVRKSGQVKEADLPSPYDVKGVRPEITDIKGNVVYEAYQHKSPKMAGLTQYKKWYQSAGQSTYMTFRRVSPNSDPNAWKHPGLYPRTFSERALAQMDVESTIARIKDGFLDALLGN